MLRFEASIYGSDRAAPLAVTFDQALAALARLPRLFIEPDGSFVWAGETADGAKWQVDGNLIDRGDVLAYVELKGMCPPDQFDVLLTCFGWPTATLAFQLPQRGVFLDEAEFRRQATTEAGAF